MIARLDYGEFKLKKSASPVSRFLSKADGISRIRTANILVISAKALANEVAKNLVLAGVGYLTVLDDGIVTDDDLGAQFFITEEDIGKNVALHL
jgi:molybdopterin/thiamine biosynthesis adenylyltransferase